MAREFKVNCSPEYLAKLLQKKGIYNRVAAKTQNFEPIHMRKRLEFARQHLADQTDWTGVIFSDETQLKCDSNCRVFVKRARGQRFHRNKIVRHKKKALKVSFFYQICCVNYLNCYNPVSTLLTNKNYYY